MKKTAIIVTTALALNLGLTGCKEDKKTLTTSDGITLTMEDCRVEKLITSKEDEKIRFRKENACEVLLKKNGVKMKEEITAAVKANYNLMCNSGHRFSTINSNSPYFGHSLDVDCRKAKEGKLK